jgi:hypothetical protein
VGSQQDTAVYKDAALQYNRDWQDCQRKHQMVMVEFSVSHEFALQLLHKHLFNLEALGPELKLYEHKVKQELLKYCEEKEPYSDSVRYADCSVTAAEEYASKLLKDCLSKADLTLVENPDGELSHKRMAIWIVSRRTGLIPQHSEHVLAQEKYHMKQALEDIRISVDNLKKTYDLESAEDVINICNGCWSLDNRTLEQAIQIKCQETLQKQTGFESGRVIQALERTQFRYLQARDELRKELMREVYSYTAFNAADTSHVELVLKLIEKGQGHRERTQLAYWQYIADHTSWGLGKVQNVIKELNGSQFERIRQYHQHWLKTPRRPSDFIGGAQLGTMG